MPWTKTPFHRLHIHWYSLKHVSPQYIHQLCCVVHGQCLQVRVLEASGRIGGRVLDDHSLGKCIGLGAMFITGISNNPFTLLSRQLDMSLRMINEETCELFNEDGERPDKQLDLAVERHYNSMLDKLSEWRSRHGSDLSLESTLSLYHFT